MKEKQILVIRKEPGKSAEVEPLFENTLEAFQAAVGGYIEAVPVTQNLCILCNETGRIDGLPYNCKVMGFDFLRTHPGGGYSGLRVCQHPGAAFSHGDEAVEREG